MWGLGTTRIVMLRSFRPIILQTNCGKLIFGKIQLWYFGITIFWPNDILAKWYVGKMMLWQNDILAKWHFGKMISLDTRWPLSKQTHWSKQTVLQIGSRNSRNLNGRRTKPKVFDLHRKNSSKNIMKQTDPQEPEYPLRSLILICWYSCAVFSNRMIVELKHVELQCVLNS